MRKKMKFSEIKVVNLQKKYLTNLQEKNRKYFKNYVINLQGKKHKFSKFKCTTESFNLLSANKAAFPPKLFL